jgi:hypothetical protein
LLIDKIKKTAINANPATLPLFISFEKAADFDYMANIRDVLLSIRPEHSFENAAKWLRDASFTMYMGRAIQGISNSCSEDLKKIFMRITSMKIDRELIESLIDILAALKDMEPIEGHEERQVQRIKAAFSLFMACKASNCTYP